MLATAAIPQGAFADTLFFDFNRNGVGNTANASVFLFGDSGQTATVTNLAGFSSSVTLNNDGFFNLPINNSFQQSGTGIVNTGFQVNSAKPIGGYFVNRAGFSTDMTYLLNSQALGTAYVVASQGIGFGEGSQVAVHATQNNTQVTFTPKGGAPIVTTLQAGETYKYAGGSTDLTGSSVVSTAPVAVFSGAECAQVPGGNTFCDTLLEQMIPNDKLSKTYAVTASQGASVTPTGADLVRVIATADNTQVTVDGTLVATLSAGDVYEYSLAKNTGSSVEASNPVMVAQYLEGGEGTQTDPALSLVPGSDEYLKSYRLSTPAGTQAFDQNYASVVVDSASLATLMLNGVLVDTSGFTGISGTGYFRGIVDLPVGLFTLDAVDPFLVMLGGGSEADSYFTYGGATFAPGVSPPVPSAPEPATWVMMLLGFGGLGYFARRKATALRASAA